MPTVVNWLKGKGTTLIEILIVVIILSILTSLAIPRYIKTVEKSKGKSAISNLRLIRRGEQMYHLQNLTYIDCSDLDEINTTLNTDIQDYHFDYHISGATATTFTATTTRNRGPNMGERITIDQDGTIDESNWSP